MTLNAGKCKVNIDFKKNRHAFEPVIVDGKELSVVSSAKILGVTLSSDLTWNDHVNEAIRKANKRLYFLVLLKRAGVNPHDIINFYCTVVRPVLEYCSPIFHHALPVYLINDIKRVQKRAPSIISPDCSYSLCLSIYDLDTLRSRREEQCFKLSNVIPGNHKLSHLLPRKNVNHYNLRRNRKYDLPSVRTKRFQRSFIPVMCRLTNNTV